MRRLTLTLLTAAIAALALAPAARAEFGLSEFDASFFAPGGAEATEATEAGAHHDFTTTVVFNTAPSDSGLVDELPDELIREIVIAQMPGLIGNPTALPRCGAAAFVANECDTETRIGVAENTVGGPDNVVDDEVFNLNPGPGEAARFGFWALSTVPITIGASVSPTPPYNIVARVANISQVLPLYASEVTLWGVPGDPSHSPPPGTPEVAFMSAPRACTGPLRSDYRATSWLGSTDSGFALTHDELGAPRGFSGCEALRFEPGVDAAPSTDVAASPSGFDFQIEIDDPGLTDPDIPAGSDLKKAVVNLPEGFTVNPASAGGLQACSEDQLERETYDSDPGEGCPNASKVASVALSTPLLEERLSGSIFLATPHENPLGELLAGYLVIKQPERGVAIKLTGSFELDSDTGQIEASFDQNPQFPFSDLEVTFPSGPRASLATPQACGEYEIETVLDPWSGGEPARETDAVRIDRAPGGGDCPDSEAQVPHRPGFDAGSALPIAGAHSPFVVNLRRDDGEQRFKNVTITPPPGLSAKLAGTPACPEAALAAAAGRGGQDEQAAPSCPAASRIGTVHAAVGSGPDPFWAPGAAYLAGPYKGAPLSIAILTPAVAGPFDLGVVVIRTALHVNPASAQITAVSDPIPEFLEGIPLDVRVASIRLDKPGFALNGTSCEPSAVSGALGSTLGGLAPLLSRFQLGECRRLGFKPRLKLRLFGGVKRGKYQALRAVVRPRPGDANIGRTVVRMPRSAFVAQENFRTICTRVQWAAEACPKGSVYGKAIAYSPLLGYPLKGAVYLRSSDNTLPDLVADLRGPAHQPIRIELVGRTDSAKGALRNTFDVVPDAPVSYFRLNLFGGDKGLIVNSRNICRGKNRAGVRLDAQNGRRQTLRPVVGNPRCKKVHRKAKRRQAARGGRGK